MEFYRCVICGDVYMGKGRPSNCPFCGAHERYLSLNQKWVDENQELTTISDISRKNLKTALQLEVNNSPFYRDAMNKTSDAALKGVLKYLSKTEGEHASVVRKILQCELIEPEPGKEVAMDDDRANVEAAHAREVAATAFYKKAAGEAVEPRVKKVFTALSEIEGDHIDLEGALLKRMG
jgi:rubrerythrin